MKDARGTDISMIGIWIYRDSCMTTALTSIYDTALRRVGRAPFSYCRTNDYDGHICVLYTEVTSTADHQATRAVATSAAAWPSG